MAQPFSLQELHETIEALHARKGCQRGNLIDFLLSLYQEEKDVDGIKKVETSQLVEAIYGPSPKDPKAYAKFLKEHSKKFSSLKSSLNTSLRDLFAKGHNQKRIGVTRNNAFGYLPESKNEIIKKLSLSLDVMSMKFFDMQKKGRAGDLDIGELVEKIKDIADFEKQAKEFKKKLQQEIDSQLSEGVSGVEKANMLKMAEESLESLKEKGLEIAKTKNKADADAMQVADEAKEKTEINQGAETALERETEGIGKKEEASHQEGTKETKGTSGGEGKGAAPTESPAGQEKGKGADTTFQEGIEGDAGSKDKLSLEGEGKSEAKPGAGSGAIEQRGIGDGGKEGEAETGEGRETAPPTETGISTGQEPSEGIGGTTIDPQAPKEEAGGGEGKSEAKPGAGSGAIEQRGIGDGGKEGEAETGEGRETAPPTETGISSDQEQSEGIGGITIDPQAPKEEADGSEKPSLESETGTQSDNKGDARHAHGKQTEGTQSSNKRDTLNTNEESPASEGGKGEEDEKEAENEIYRRGKDIDEEEDWAKGKVGEKNDYEELTEEEKKWLEEKRAKEKEEEERRKAEEESPPSEEGSKENADPNTDGEFEEELGMGISVIRKPLGRMIEVPKGPFVFGSNLGDISYRPEKMVEIEGFLLSQYPVNNFQFSKFIEKTNYVTEAEIENRSWVFSGKVWNRVVEMNEDGYEDEQIIYEKGSLHEVEGANWKHPAGPFSSIETSMDQPVVHISMKDALEFLHWRSEATGKGFRLPTEMEWEKSARGPEGLIYPWGNEWDPSKCTSFESTLNGITDVDFYQFETPYHINDLIGNVWEWTLGTEHPLTHEEAVKQLTVKERKNYPALKGGSWMTSRENMKSYTRMRYHPSMRSNFIGFRCSRSLEDR